MLNSVLLIPNGKLKIHGAYYVSYQMILNYQYESCIVKISHQITITGLGLVSLRKDICSREHYEDLTDKLKLSTKLQKLALTFLLSLKQHLKYKNPIRTLSKPVHI